MSGINTDELMETSGGDVNLRPLLETLRRLIQQGREQARAAVDSIQVQTCWEIGRHVIEFEQGGADRAEYGKGAAISACKLTKL